MIPFKPNSYPDESPASFLIRISFEIGHDNVLDMVRAHGNIYQHKNLSATLSIPIRYRNLMRSLGIDHDCPKVIVENPGQGFQYRFFDGIKINCSYLRGDLEAFCPECLRAETYWKRRWSLRLYTICEKHGCELIDQCQKCALPLTMKRRCIYECPKCDFDLRKSKSTHPNQKTQQRARHLFSPTIDPIAFKLALNVFTSVDKCFKKSLTDTEKMEISQMLIEAPEDAGIKLRKALAKNKLDTHPRIHCLPILMNRHSASAAEAALKKLGAVNFSESKQWTTSFLNLFEAAKLLNVSVQVIKKLLKWEILSVVGRHNRRRIPSDTMISLLDKTPDQLRQLIDEASGHAADIFRYVSAAQAIKLLGMTYTMLWTLVRRNYLKTAVKIINSHKRNTIDRDSIEAFKNTYAISGTLAKKFGVPKQSVSNRLRALKIYPVSGPSIDGTITNVFKISDLRGITKSSVKNAKFDSKKSSVIHKHKIDERKYITMKCAATSLGIGLMTVSKLTKEGILNRIDISHRNVLIEKKSVDKLIKRITHPDYVRLQDIRESTGLKGISFWHYFINSGVIKIVQLFSWQLIHKRCIKKMSTLMSKYVTETEGNKMLGTDLQSLISYRKNGNVKFKKITGQLHDVYFYSRKSIEDLIKAKAVGL